MKRELESTKISCGQAVSLLVLARLFILLIFVPETNNSVIGTASMLGIFLGFFLTILLMIPGYLLLKQNPGKDLFEISRQQSRTLGKVTAVLFYFVCMALVVETTAQFTMFLTNAVYPRASNVWITIIFCAALCYLGYLGLEALGRSGSIILFLALILSLLIGMGLWKFYDGLNLLTPFYDGVMPVVRAMEQYVTQNVELVVLGLILSNVREKSSAKTFLRYHLIASIVLLAVGFSSIVVLGHYGHTRNFPIYTMFVLSGSNVFYRLDYLVIMIWTATALIRAALYLILASRMLNEWTGRKLKKQALVYNTLIAAAMSVWAAKDLQWFRKIYRFVASGIPVIGLAILLPIVLLILQRRKQKGEVRSDEAQ